MTRLFLISLGVTCLACVILFLYFRHRISRMEQKVDLMFQLIQEYEQNKNITYQQSVNEPTDTVPYMTQEGGHRNDDDLISVSDDDRDLDSDEVSDDDDDEITPLNIKESVPSNIKSISLSGAEVESLTVEPADDLDEISDLDDIAEVITLEETNNEEIIDTDDNIKSNEEVEEVINNIEEVYVKKVNVLDDEVWAQKSVKELKQICEDKGFTNYKGLRKNKLVELLAASQ